MTRFTFCLAILFPMTADALPIVPYLCGDEYTDYTCWSCATGDCSNYSQIKSLVKDEFDIVFYDADMKAPSCEYGDFDKKTDYGLGWQCEYEVIDLIHNDPFCWS